MNTKDLNYKIIGEGEPVIILHGFYPDIGSMTNALEPIFENIDGYKRIYIDHPGTGKSKSSNLLKNSDDILQTIINFIDQIIPNENFLIIGESYGGLLARGLVNKMQQRVNGVALICPVVSTKTNRNAPDHQILSTDKKLMHSLSDEEKSDFNEISVIQTRKIYERYRDEVLSGTKIANSKFLENIRNNGYDFSFKVDDLQKPLNKPSLIIVGKQDSVVGYKDALSLIDNYPRMSLAILDGAGHNLKIEQETQFSMLISDWLLRLKNKNTAAT